MGALRTIPRALALTWLLLGCDDDPQVSPDGTADKKDAGQASDSATPVPDGGTVDAGRVRSDAGGAGADAGDAQVDAATCSSDGGAPPDGGWELVASDSEPGCPAQPPRYEQCCPIGHHEDDWCTYCPADHSQSAERFVCAGDGWAAIGSPVCADLLGESDAGR